MTTLPRDYPDFGLTPDQRRAAVHTHYYEYPGMDGELGEIWCYSDAFAYFPGDTVTLFVCSMGSTFDLEVIRDGATEVPVMLRRGLAAGWQDTPEECSVTGCGWEPSFAFNVPDDWPSGAYRISLTAEGRQGRPIRCHHLIVVRPRPGRRPGRLLQVASTGTWLAYNSWGGSNHYEGITGPNRTAFATTVSRDRPWCRGFVVLPPEAPRVPVEVSVQPSVLPRYPHMEWAYATGHSKKYASAGWASYDRHFFRWAERNGYAVDLISQFDLQFEPEIIRGYDCAVFVGHDEYWSWEMRDTVDSYVDQGGRAARFAGNFLWQTRIGDGGRKQVCYKYRARSEDPVYRSGDISRATTAWEAPEIGRPGAGTFGLNALRGLYAGWGGCAPRGARGFPVYRPEHWAFVGTGISYGDLLGAEGHVFGYEVDGLEYEIRGGLPYPAAGSGAPDGTEILALGLASLVENRRDLPAENGFLGDEDGRFAAEILFGEPSDDNLEKVRRGNGMIVNFARGRGEVFHAGSCEWVAGLLRRDAMVERVTSNVLNRYLT